MISEVQEYFDTLKMDKSPHTIRAYLASVNMLLSFFQVNSIEDLEKITPKDLRKFQEHLRQNGSELSTINARLRPIKAMYNWLLENEYIETMPKIKELKTPKKITHFLSEEEVSLMIKGAKNDLDKLIIALLITTGLRRNELITLKLSDYDGTHIIVNGKGNKQRKLILQKDVKDLLDKWIVKRNAKYGNKLDYIFISKSSTKFNGASILDKVKSVMSNAGFSEERIKQIHTHSLRHTFVANLFESGADIYAAKMALGHQQLSTTQIYAHLRNTALDRALNNMKSIVKG